jgi:hypothetical protein
MSSIQNGMAELLRPGRKYLDIWDPEEEKKMSVNSVFRRERKSLG